MDYQLHYNRLIRKARRRKLKGYKERHHIIPSCLNGSNDLSNIVLLTPEEHYVAHLLLVKMNPGNVKLLWAAMAMTGTTKYLPRKNKIYGWLRRKLSVAQSEIAKKRKYNKLTRLKMRINHKGMSGRKHSEETKRKMSLAAKGKKKSIAHRVSMSECRKQEANRPGRRKQLSKQARKQWSSSSFRKRFAKVMATVDRSYMQTPEYRRMQSERTRAAWARRKSASYPTKNARLTEG